MKLMRVGDAGRERPAVLVDGVPHDASDVAPDDFGASFFAGDGLNRLRIAVEERSLPTLDMNGQRIGAPIARPGKVVCIGLNYADHAEEAGVSLPAEPVVFFKAPNTVVGPNDDVLLPIGSAKTDWEVELAAVVGSTARYLDNEGEGAAAVAGYAVSNDVSERAFQLERGGQWVKGKSCETFNPLGPWLVTADEFTAVAAAPMWLEVNGERMQDSSTGRMVFSPGHLICYLSQVMVLEPGDVVSTGTPAGVGLGLDPPRYLVDGDVMELGIDGLGVQRQRCRRARRSK